MRVAFFYDCTYTCAVLVFTVLLYPELVLSGEAISVSCNDNATRHQYDIHTLYSVSTFSLLVSDSCIDNDLLFIILILIVLVVETLLLIIFLYN
jgi:hypothetical protein